jgi:hypothetical protein
VVFSEVQLTRGGCCAEAEKNFRKGNSRPRTEGIKNNRRGTTVLNAKKWMIEKIG